MLKESEIIKLYNERVAVNYHSEYDNRYVPLPVGHNNKKWKWENKDFPRVIALLEFRRYMLEYDITFKKALSFNGEGDPEWEYVKCDNRHNYNYVDDKVKYDLHGLELPTDGFDFAMVNQTIEHLYDPILALKNIYKHMCLGGVFYANVPSNSVPHDTPFHYYTGVTPIGLGAMVTLAGFDILEIGQWGNVDYYNTSVNIKWPDYRVMGHGVPNGPGYNDRNCPAITWCLAIKNK